MARGNAQNPVGATPVSAPAGTETAPVEAATATAVEKIISEDLANAIIAASNGLRGEAVGNGSLADAARAALEAGEGRFIDPSLSQYKEGLCLFFDPDHSVVRNVEVGRNDNHAYCVTVPAGMVDAQNNVVFNKAFNAYVSTFRKEIRVHDENGEPVLEAGTNNPVVRGGGTNTVWNEMRGYTSVSEMLNAMSGRRFVCRRIIRDFGPANYIGPEGERRPTGHRLTSLPLFEEILRWTTISTLSGVD